MIEAIIEKKKAVRKDTLARRRQLPSAEIASQSQSMMQHFTQWESYRKANTIMLFLSMPDEPDMNGIIQHALDQGKTVCVPYTKKEMGIMEAVKLRSLNDLVVGKFNIKSPNPDTLEVIAPESIDIIMVPGVAFEKGGKRMGMGGGYYDRFLFRAGQAIRIGASLRETLLKEVPTEDFDMLMHYILVADGIVACPAEGKMQ